jgi:hypothetical protein
MLGKVISNCKTVRADEITSGTMNCAPQATETKKEKLRYRHYNQLKVLKRVMQVPASPNMFVYKHNLP